MRTASELKRSGAANTKAPNTRMPSSKTAMSTHQKRWAGPRFHCVSTKARTLARVGSGQGSAAKNVSAVPSANAPAATAQPSFAENPASGTVGRTPGVPVTGEPGNMA
jgi:hypothetical protein